MSLIAAILLGAPPPVFQGKKRVHLMDKRSVISASGCDNNAMIRQANVESVLAAVKNAGDAMTTVAQIAAETTIGRITVCSALRELEVYHKVIRIRRAKQTFFKAKS